MVSTCSSLILIIIFIYHIWIAYIDMIVRYNRTEIYMHDKDKIALMRKAHKMGISLSKLLVKGGFQYEEDHEKKRGE